MRSTSLERGKSAASALMRSCALQLGAAQRRGLLHALGDLLLHGKRDPENRLVA